MYKDNKGEIWLKGNLHTHTTVSDGIFSPDEALTLYEKNGYDFVALTDHWKWNGGSQSSKLLVLSGIEYDFGTRCGCDIYHIVAIGCNSEPHITKSFTPQMAIDEIHSNGGIACLAHPAWSLNSPDDLIKLKNVDTTEIFNSISDLPFNCRPYSGVILDIMAAKGSIWKLSAADDTHFYEKSDTCRSFIYVNAKDNNEKEIIKALKAGKYYASQGPLLDIEFENDVLYVESSPVSEMVFFTDKAYTSDRSITGDNITYGEYKLKVQDSFVRVEVKDKAGNYAWSQYYLKNSFCRGIK